MLNTKASARRKVISWQSWGSAAPQLSPVLGVVGPEPSSGTTAAHCLVAVFRHLLLLSINHQSASCSFVVISLHFLRFSVASIAMSTHRDVPYFSFVLTYISSDNTSTPASLMLHLVIFTEKSQIYLFVYVVNSNLFMIFHIKYVHSDSEIFHGLCQ